MTDAERVRHRPTSAAVLPLGLALLMVALLGLTGNSWFLLLAGATFAVLSLTVVSRAHISDFSFTTQHAPRVAVGDVLDSALRIANHGRRTTSPVSLLLRTAGFADVTAYVGALRPGQSVELRPRLRAISRGVAQSMHVQLVANPALGLVRAASERTLAEHVTIHPERVATRGNGATGRRVGMSEVEVVRSTGSELFGLREWRRGDDQRHVHWRSTARRNRLVVAERAEAALPVLGLVLLGPADDEEFETAVSGAASVCDRGVRMGRQVSAGAWLPGGFVLAPTGSPVELLDWWAGLSQVELPDPQSFASTVLTVFGSGELLVAGPTAALTKWLPDASGRCALRLCQLEVVA